MNVETIDALVWIILIKEPQSLFHRPSCCSKVPNVEYLLTQGESGFGGLSKASQLNGTAVTVECEAYEESRLWPGLEFCL